MTNTIEAEIRKFVAQHAMRGDKLVPARMQSMLALLESLRERPELRLKFHLSDSGQSIVSHETLGERVHRRLSLTPRNKNHGRTSSNLHAWGEPLLTLLETAGFGAADESTQAETLDCVQAVIGSYLRASPEESPLKARVHGRTAEAVIAEILRHAERRGKTGDVAQRLVEAKLSIRLQREIHVHGANKGGRKLRECHELRFDTFEIENAVFKVAVGVPDDVHLDQIGSILDRPKREAWLLTCDDRVAIWQSEIAKRFGTQARRVVVKSVESFVGQNVSEMAGFSFPGKNERLHELVDLYNSRWVEGVGSANIRIALE